MVIKYHISPYPALTENMVVKVYEAQAPEAEVYSQVLPAPHDTPKSIVINGLDKVVHIVRLYTQGSAAKLHEYNVEPTTDAVNLFDPIRFKIGDGGAHTPAAYSSSYENPLLAGLGEDDYLVFRNNIGYLFPGLHYQNEPTSGGFTLNNDAFNENEEVLIQRKPSVLTTVVNDSVVGKWFGGFINLAGSQAYQPEHLRKLLRLSGDATYNFAADAAIPIGYGFCFQHYGIPGIAKVNFLNAPLLYGDTAINQISINSKSEACFTFDGTNWNVVYLTEKPEVSELEIIAKGALKIGDVWQRDQVFTVRHNKAIQGDYIVMTSIRSDNPNMHHRDNTMGYCWFHSPTDKTNEFKISFQEFNRKDQNISLCWLIVKI